MKTILLIDDDFSTSRPLIQDLESESDFKFVYVVSPDDALDSLKGCKFDAIILDIMMSIPNDWSNDEKRSSESGLSTGEVLFKKIREICPDIPILIYSAKKIQSITKNEKTDILRKPELFSEIVTRIDKLLSHE